MYGFECSKKLRRGACPDKRCLYPVVCPSWQADHHHLLELLRKIRRVKGVKKGFVALWIRYDVLLSDKECGKNYLRELVDHDISGQMQVAA